MEAAETFFYEICILQYNNTLLMIIISYGISLMVVAVIHTVEVYDQCDGRFE